MKPEVESPLNGTKSEKTSALDIDGQMSLFNETEYFADPNAKEPKLVEVEKHLRKRKYVGQREELIKGLPHSKVLHTIDESEQVCEKCGNSMVRVGEEFVRTEVQFGGQSDHVKLASGRLSGLDFPCGLPPEAGTAETGLPAYR